MMKHLALASAILAFAAIPAFANEAKFERNLTVNGHVELSVSTGAGHIHITHGSGDRVHIVGRVKSNWGSGDDKVQEIANNPPIEQTGNIIHIGPRHENYHHITIDYDIEAPANSFLEANSGSGDIDDDGVGENAKIGTGSGGIHATGLQGGFVLNTGSGNIYAEQTSQGDVKAETGSGGIELKGLHGSLRANTGSGNIKVTGTPSSDWKLQTGSGNIEFWAGNSGFTLDASTGSGTVHSDPEMVVQGSFDKHHITAKVHGGGPTVRMETGSGDVRVH
jgi:Putative adhesin